MSSSTVCAASPRCSSRCPYRASEAALLVVVVLIAYASLNLYDEKLRRWLGRRLRQREAGLDDRPRFRP